MIRRAMLMLFYINLSAPAAYAQDDVLEKIRLLEQQIQELKDIKQRQAVTEVKRDQCMKAFSREKFCRCISESLPREVGFEQYVHTLVTSREKLGYESMTAEQKQGVDATVEARDKCVEKGFFK